MSFLARKSHLWEISTLVNIKISKEDGMKKQSSTVKMDNKQRVCVTRALSKEERENFSSFRMYREGGKIILEPIIEVPAKDHWIYNDPKALASLMRGIKDAEEGRLNDLGSFAKDATEDDEDKHEDT